MKKAQYMIGIVETVDPNISRVRLVTPVPGGFTHVPVDEAALAEVAKESSSDHKSALYEALQEGAIRPEILAIREGTTANFNTYVGKELLGGKLNAEGHPSGVASWYTPYPKPILVNHDTECDPLGRVQGSEDAKYCKTNGRSSNLIYPTITQPEGVAKIMRGEYLTGSIGVQSDAAVCSICGHDVVSTRELCDHWKGRKYNSEGEPDSKSGAAACWTMGALWYYEYSMVNQPASSSSGILRINTKEFVENLQKHGDIVLSGEKLNRKSVCYSCKGEESQCSGDSKCTHEAWESFYVIKVHEHKSHFAMNGHRESTGANSNKEASMIIIPADMLLEAKLSTKTRKNLPDSAFCGPNRSYPAHDAAHVRNGLARLSQFGGKMSSAAKAKILGCLRSRAAKFGIKTGGNDKKEMVVATGDEAVAFVDKYCQEHGLVDVLAMVTSKTEAELATMLAEAWTQADTDAIVESDREELTAETEFLKKLPESAFAGPQSTWPILDGIFVQVAKAMISWPSVREGISEEQRVELLTKVESFESNLEESGKVKDLGVEAPSWLEADDYVAAASMIELTLQDSISAFKAAQEAAAAAAAGTGQGDQPPATQEKTCTCNKTAPIDPAKEQELAQLKDQLVLKEKQISQLRAEIAQLNAASESQKTEITTLQEKVAKMSATTHGELVEKIVALRKDKVGDSEDKLRERYSKMTIDTLQHLHEEFSAEATPGTTLPPAKPETQTGTPPAGAGVQVENAGGSTEQSSKAATRFEAAATRTGAIVAPEEDSH